MFSVYLCKMSRISIWLYRLCCAPGLLHVVLLALQLGVHGIDRVFIHQLGIQRQSLHHLHVQLRQLRVLPVHVHHQQQISKRYRSGSAPTFTQRHVPVDVLQLLVNEGAHLIASTWWDQKHDMLRSRRQMQEQVLVSADGRMKKT